MLDFIKRNALVIIAILILGGLLLSLTNNPIRRSYIKSLTKELQKERDSFRDLNQGLLKQIENDTLLVKDRKILDSLKEQNDALKLSLDRVLKRIKRNEKNLNDYGGDIDKRFSEFADHFTPIN